jgi:CO/xanthine dehydrogenase FAD-binding subunit
MTAFLRPASWSLALQLRAEHPDALVVAGGTDVCVDINFGRLRPQRVLDISAVPELAIITRSDGRLRIGAGVTYSQLVAEIQADLPALAAAARTVGSPQIRNRGTIGGNLGTSSPAGDCHPLLLASGAEIEIASLTDTRMVAAAEFFLAPKRNVLQPGELVAAVHIPRADGPQVFAKAGTRNAMVIAACSLALVLDPQTRRVGTGIGSAGPVPLRAVAAQDYLAGALTADGQWDRPRTLPPELISGFADRVAAAARPIDDVRGSAVYRVHCLRVLAGRALSWAWDEFQGMS